MWEEQSLAADCTVVVSQAMVDHVAVASQAIAEPMQEGEKEEDEEADVLEGSFTIDLVPEQVAVPWATMPVAPRL